MKFNRLSRRMFLQGSGTTLAIPFLASLMPRELWAQSSASTIKRAIFLVNTLDYGRHENWYPSMAQPSQQLVSPNGDRTLRYQALSSYLSSSTASFSRIFGNHLNAHLGSINLIRGMDFSTRYAHGAGFQWGNIQSQDHDSGAQGLAPLRTIDNVLRDNTRFNPINRDVAVMGSMNFSFRRAANGSIQRSSSISETPRGVFNYLFDGGRLPEGGSTTVPTAHPRRALLDNVLEDYNRVINGSQISAEDRIALTNATDLIADIQRGLAGGTTTQPGACRYRQLNPGNGLPTYNNTTTMRQWADIISAAVMCDVTRVFNFGTYLDDSVYDQHPNEDFHQGHSHIPFSTVNGKVNWQYMGEIQNDYVRNFLAPLISNLAGATDPSNGQTYLYNSMINYTLECGQVHGHNTHPAFIAGNGGGSIPTGYLLDYTDRSRPHPWSSDGFSNAPNDARFSHEYVGLPINRLYNTMFQWMGLTPADYESNAINSHFQGRSDGRWGAVNNGITNMGGYGHWGPNSSPYGTDYMNRQSLYNLHFFKNTLPMPARSA